MHCHCGTNNRAPRWTFPDPCKPEVRPGNREESASPAWLAAPAMNACDTTISNGTSVEQSKYFRQRNFFPWFKCKSYWLWSSYQRLRQTRWLRISYCQFPLVERWWSYGVYISQMVRFARCYISVSDFNSKNLQITSKLLTQGYRYHKLRKTFGKFFRSYSDLLSKFGDISFQEWICFGRNLSPGLLWLSSLHTKEGQMWREFRLVGLVKIVKRLRRRKYDPVIIERTIGLVLGPSTALYRSFLKQCTLTNKVVGTIHCHP